MTLNIRKSDRNQDNVNTNQDSEMSLPPRGQPPFGIHLRSSIWEFRTLQQKAIDSKVWLVLMVKELCELNSWTSIRGKRRKWKTKHPLTLIIHNQKIDNLKLPPNEILRIKNYQLDTHGNEDHINPKLLIHVPKWYIIIMIIRIMDIRNA